MSDTVSDAVSDAVSDIVSNLQRVTCAYIKLNRDMFLTTCTYT